MSQKLIFLGNAQDGGVPQIGCDCHNCHRFQRTAASIAIVENGNTILIDATPDIRSQLTALKVQHNVEVSKVYLTHAHWGHYGGLPMFGKESLNVKDMPVFMTQKMAGFLLSNEPFSTLFKSGNLVANIIQRFPFDSGIPLTGEGIRTTYPNDALNVQAVSIPHREEFSDTVAYTFNLNSKPAIYMPDVDELTPDVEKLIRSYDIAIIDGCFYSEGELSGRDMKSIGHPVVNKTVEQLADISERIIFTHLNHSNPLVDPESIERKKLEEMGFRVAEEGMALE